MVTNLTNLSDPEDVPDPNGELKNISGCQPGDFFNVLGLLLQAILAALAFSLLMGNIRSST